jgi:hypothetical protein
MEGYERQLSVASVVSAAGTDYYRRSPSLDDYPRRQATPPPEHCMQQEPSNHQRPPTLQQPEEQRQPGGDSTQMHLHA